MLSLWFFSSCFDETFANLFCLCNLILNLLCSLVFIPTGSQLLYVFGGWSFFWINVPTFLHQVTIKFRCVFVDLWTKTFTDLKIQLVVMRNIEKRLFLGAY